MTRVFISHSTRNDEFVTDLAADLREAGVRTWVDHHDIQPSEDWDAAVQTAMEATDAMVLVLTDEAVASQNVKVEWNFFLELGKPIYPVMLEKCQVPFRLRLLQYVDFTRDSGVATRQLLRALQASDWGSDDHPDAERDTADTISAATARQIDTKLVLSGHRLSVSDVAFSPDGEMVASSSEDKNVRLWYTTRRRQIKVMIGHEKSVNAITFSPDNQMIASASDDRTIRLWSVPKRYGITALYGHKSEVLGVAFSPDSALLASAGDDGTVRLWRVKTLREITALEGHAGPVYDVVFSPSGALLLSAGADRTVRMWDVDEQTEAAVITASDSIRRLAFSPDGRFLALGLNADGLALLDAATQETVATVRYADYNAKCVRGVAFSADGTLLAMASLDGSIRVFKVASLIKSKQPRALKVLRGHEGGLCGLEFSPDGVRMASASHDETVRLWTVAR